MNMKRQEEKNIFKNPKLKRLLSIAVSFQSYPDRYTNDKKYFRMEKIWCDEWYCNAQIENATYFE